MNKKKKFYRPPVIYVCTVYLYTYIYYGCLREKKTLRITRIYTYYALWLYYILYFEIRVITIIIVGCICAQLHNQNRIVLAYCWPGYRRGPQGTGFGYTVCYRSKTTWKTANSQSSSAQIKYLRK
jgi:hypothetical protein